MAESQRIPLFPLGGVLFPSISLPLHIFEPRYKVMIRECLVKRAEFGIVLASNDSIAKTGCTAAILKTIKEYDDGRLDILSEGRRVFALLQVFDEKEYYEGAIEYLSDEPAQLTAAMEDELLRTFQQCHILLFGRTWGAMEPTEPGMLAYQVAAHLPLDLAHRQKLLEIRKEEDRRAFLLERLTQLQPTLVEREKKRQRATGNGHALN